MLHFLCLCSQVDIKAKATEILSKVDVRREERTSSSDPERTELDAREKSTEYDERNGESENYMPYKLSIWAHTTNPELFKFIING